MQSLNARYLLCPLPVIRVQDRVKLMQQGEVLEVVCTDPGTVHDIPAWCRINGHRVIESKYVDEEYTFTLEVGSRFADEP
ncbi:MAG: sulfurtransferase TusA family protein [Methylococcaceae bacterium]|nr:sulfurtransferase TusA family protein [Methylococcaceae bacterium]MCI0667989.1 sulfurtransferase TusA family protein [Methylococcaceae bacterium]MCI0732658.1 sulfurtransferase TusA family protein [Methylococcaceae bacterium]